MKKLQNGDYCENLTKEQLDQLMFMDNINFKKYSLQCWVMIEAKTKVLTMAIVNYGTTDEQYKVMDKNKLSFEDFKQKAINTLDK